MAQQKVRIPIPSGLKPDEREALADLIVEHIVDRTQRGLDKDGNRFPKYSKSYKKSLDFKIAGKTSKVDLTLSGDMLAALEALRHDSRSITVGYEAGTEENDRAEGNIKGSYGRSPNPSKARNFLGIKDRKLQELVEFVKAGG